MNELSDGFYYARVEEGRITLTSRNTPERITINLEDLDRRSKAIAESEKELDYLRRRYMPDAY